MFSYTFMSMQMRSFVYSSLDQRAISQLSFGTMFGSPGYMAAEIYISFYFFLTYSFVCVH